MEVKYLTMYRTGIAYSDEENIFVHGYNLSELLGEIGLADMAFLGAKGRIPDTNESKMLNAIMVALSEHGFTPSTMSARLTYLGAPESVQAAVAAGLLGAGSVYLGSMEKTAELLQAHHKEMEQEQIDKIAKKIVDTNERLPGFGHPIHKHTDPRTKRLFELADELGFYKENCLLINEIHQALIKKKKKHIVLNASGAVGAILTDMNFDSKIIKCFAVAARSVGLIGHILEESQEKGIGQELWDHVQRNTEYQM